MLCIVQLTLVDNTNVQGEVKMKGKRGSPQDGSPGIGLTLTPGLLVPAAGTNGWTGLAAGECSAIWLLLVMPLLLWLLPVAPE